MELGLRPATAWSCIAVIGVAVLACAMPRRGEPPDVEDAQAPELGEIMAATQMRHLKLWYAGEAENWRLASYEIDELEEGFADTVRFHPEHKESPRPLTELVPEFTAGPIATLRQAIARGSRPEFEAAHDALTQGCNGCHIAANFSFNVVTRPTGNPYRNQSFEAPK